MQEIYHIFFSNSPQMNILKTIINEIAKTDITVLIKGESGAEKELLARTIHINSRKAAERGEKEAIQEVLQKPVETEKRQRNCSI
jgi:transcriptional regulator with PAS, ATPase and Fis domain